MNLRTTIFLLILAAGGALAWWGLPKIAPQIGLVPRRVDPKGAGSLDVLDRQFTRDSVSRIEVDAGPEPVVLEKGQSGVWALPGQWPTRKQEAEELVSLITGLHSRFQLIPLTAAMDLKPYGLDKSQHPVSVKVKTAEGEYRLEFGEPQQAEGSPFARPTYLQVNDKPEVVRLGPDLIPILKRPREFYQRRQLFPEVERVKFTDNKSQAPFMPPTGNESTGPALLPRAQYIAIEGPLGKVSLRRLGEFQKPEDLASTRCEPLQLADQWELTEPVKDRPEPDRLKALLAAIPDLWVEKFIDANNPATIATLLINSPDEGIDTLRDWLATSTPAERYQALLHRTGLDAPERTLRLTLLGGDVAVLQIGGVSSFKERKGQPPPPNPNMPFQPPAPTIREEYRYARLAPKGSQSSEQTPIFELRADKFNDLFVAASSLEDEKLARFQSKDVNRVEITQPSGKIVLVREKDEKKADRWRVTQPIQALGEYDKISELINKLEGLDARVPDVIYSPDLKATGFDSPTNIKIDLALEEELPGPNESKVPRKRTIEFVFGKQDTAAKKVNVRVTGRERVNLVDESVLKLAERPALAYRGRRILDFDAAQVAKIDVKRPSETYSLQQVNSEWKLAAPVTATADKNKAVNLAEDLSRLEAVEYVNDAPKPDDLKNAGLDAPALTATITLADATKPPVMLLIGKQRETKPEYFAKLADGTSIFVIRKDVRDKIDQNSLDFRPLQLWQLAAEAISDVKIQRGGDKYELKKDGADWKITGPFSATASFFLIAPMLDALANPKIAGYQAHSAAKPEEFGLDKPRLQITFNATEKTKDGDKEKEAPRERTLLIGKAVEGKPEVFAKLADDPAIIKLPEAVFINADKPALDLLDRRLLTDAFRPVTKIQRTGTTTMTATKEEKNWKIESGMVSFQADQPSLAAMLRTWGTLQADRFVAYGKDVDAAKYGLNPPVDSITFTLQAEMGGKPETHVLKLGKDVENGHGERYARMDDNPGIAVLPTPVVKELTRGYLDFADKSMLKFDPADLNAIRRAMPNNDLELERKNNWKVTKPTEQQADQQTMDDLAAMLSNLRAERVADYGATDLKKYGLDVPSATVTLVLEKDGKPVTHILKFGAPVDPKAPDGDRYAQVEGSKVIAVLPRMIAKRLLDEPLKYRDKTLVKRLAEPDRVTMERGDRAGDKKVVFTKADGNWKLTAPVTADAEHADMEDYLNALYKLRADEWVAEKPKDLKEYGLDKPEITWKFFAGDKEVLSLLIGKRDSTDQRCYAKLGNSDMVFLLEPQVTARATAEYRKRSLWTGFDAAQVDSLTISGEGGSFTLRKTAGSWQVDGKPEQKVKAETVTEMLGALANLKVERFVADKDAPMDLYGLSKPRRTIVAQTSGGMKQELQLGNLEGGSKRAYARLPGKTEVFVLSEVDTAKLDRDPKALADGK
jgi:hypothetical protein